MKLKEKTINCVEDAIGIIRDYRKRITDTNKNKNDSFVNYLKPVSFIEGLWFRGEKDFNQSGLTPSIFRQHVNASESTIIEYFPTIT